MINALSVDLEDYYHVSAAEAAVRYEDWDDYESRVEDNTREVLSLLKEFNVKATFFVLGHIAEKFPDLVREVYTHGHEIACHGYNHRLVYTQRPELFRKDIRRSKKVLEKVSGQEIIGYRAPSNSITDKSLWALDILVEEGFKYDSSIFPVRHFRYGIPHGERFIHRIDLGGKQGIVEFPISTIRILGRNIAVCGGGYMRFYPASFVKWAVRSINKKGYPAMVYFHPWEIDPNQPRMGLNGASEFKHYVNVNTHLYKLRKLLSDLEFTTIQKNISTNNFRILPASAY